MRKRGANLFKRNLAGQRLGYCAGIGLTVAVGVLLFIVGHGLERFSYDAPFSLLRDQVPDDLVMVYLDAKVKANMGEPTDQPLDRKFHARLVEKLKKDGAKLVLYDILFDQPSANAESDAAFARAIREHGRVVLVAESVKQLQGNALTDATIPPVKALEEAAAGYGLANVDNDQADFNVRRIDGGTETQPSVSRVAAALLKAGGKQEREDWPGRWLNYYCSPANFRAVNMDQALLEAGLTNGYFRNRIVVVGARTEGTLAGTASDVFGNPYSRLYSRFGNAPSPGAAVHALSLLNLTRGDWLTRLSAGREILVVILWGMLISVILMRLAPWPAIGVAVVSAGLFAAAAFYLQLSQRTWFSWAVPVAAQTPTALIWAVGYRYVIEARQKQRVRRALSAYLSPYMADRVANSEVDLAPGGREVEATIMFTDLEGFTKLSEESTPEEISRLLVAYFNRTTKAIMDQDGMVIKYIGDAVMAAWGAPLPEPNPAERAIIAGWGLSESTQEEIHGRRLRTRVGINTGKVLAGNLGSDVRFDYTFIGDAANVAARLESLNKQLGTQILISETTRRQAGGRIEARSLGQFIVAGKSNAIVVYEVLGVKGGGQPELEWAKEFARGLQCFTEGNFAEARRAFAEVIRARGGGDGPSQFFLARMEALGESAPTGWDGVVRLAEK